MLKYKIKDFRDLLACDVVYYQQVYFTYNKTMISDIMNHILSTIVMIIKLYIQEL